MPSSKTRGQKREMWHCSKMDKYSPEEQKTGAYKRARKGCNMAQCALKDIPVSSPVKVRAMSAVEAADAAIKVHDSLRSHLDSRINSVLEYSLEQDMSGKQCAKFLGSMRHMVQQCQQDEAPDANDAVRKCIMKIGGKPKHDILIADGLVEIELPKLVIPFPGIVKQMTAKDRQKFALAIAEKLAKMKQAPKLVALAKEAKPIIKEASGIACATFINQIGAIVKRDEGTVADIGEYIEAFVHRVKKTNMNREIYEIAVAKGMPEAKAMSESERKSEIYKLKKEKEASKQQAPKPKATRKSKRKAAPTQT